jgi:hypothetical protein
VTQSLQWAINTSPSSYSVMLHMLQCLGPLCTAHQARLAANPLIAGMSAPRRRLSLSRRFPEFDATTLQLLSLRAGPVPF